MLPDRAVKRAEVPLGRFIVALFSGATIHVSTRS
ncbi:unnamed protein product [Penicillium roqueforti FM164]|uniref:Genomic scaffold, ProqFM164S02 n=1 Tax=Penicillium roqueforti (strain FM164) TaxID=1365484 RepID=W6QLG2_PENRF|nr:unnamed protein product [Penicillium roqueforti FM164]